MGKIFKRTLATIMVVLMVITSAPLGGFVGMEWDWLSFEAEAAETELTSEEAVDIYMSKKSVWIYDDFPFYASYAEYFFIDLDFDGVLELVSGYNVGSNNGGEYKFYKINRSNKDVKSIGTFALDLNFFRSQKLLCSVFPQQAFQLFESKKTFQKFYVGGDYVHAGSDYDEAILKKILFNNGGAVEQIISMAYTNSPYNITEDSRKFYLYGNGFNQVSKADYLECLSKLKSVDNNNLNLKIKPIVAESFESYSKSKQKQLLLESYKAFSYDGMAEIKFDSSKIEMYLGQLSTKNTYDETYVSMTYKPKNGDVSTFKTSKLEIIPADKSVVEIKQIKSINLLKGQVDIYASVNTKKYGKTKLTAKYNGKKVAESELVVTYPNQLKISVEKPKDYYEIDRVFFDDKGVTSVGSIDLNLKIENIFKKDVNYSISDSKIFEQLKFKNLRIRFELEGSDCLSFANNKMQKIIDKTYKYIPFSKDTNDISKAIIKELEKEQLQLFCEDPNALGRSEIEKVKIKYKIYFDEPDFKRDASFDFSAKETREIKAENNFVFNLEAYKSHFISEHEQAMLGSYDSAFYQMFTNSYAQKTSFLEEDGSYIWFQVMSKNILENVAYLLIDFDETEAYEIILSDIISLVYADEKAIEKLINTGLGSSYLESCKSILDKMTDFWSEAFNKKLADEIKKCSVKEVADVLSGKVKSGIAYDAINDMLKDDLGNKLIKNTLKFDKAATNVLAQANVAADTFEGLVDSLNLMSAFEVFETMAKQQTDVFRSLSQVALKNKNFALYAAINDFLMYLEGSELEKQVLTTITTTYLSGKAAIEYVAEPIEEGFIKFIETGIASVIDKIFGTASAEVVGSFFTGFEFGRLASDLICNSGDYAEHSYKAVAAGKISCSLRDVIITLLKDMIGDRYITTAYDKALSLDFALEMFKELEVMASENMAKAYESTGSSVAAISKKTRGKYEDLVAETLAVKANAQNTYCHDVEIEKLYSKALGLKQSALPKNKGFFESALDYKTICVQCPVNVFVKNASGKTVASVDNNKITKTTKGIEILVIGDEKFISMPANQVYDVKLVATDKGKMNYTVYEYDASNASAVREVAYNNISLTKDKSFTAKVNKYSYTSKNNYNLTSGSTTIKPTTDDYVATTAISLSGNKTNTVYVGGNLTLNITTTPKNASAQKVVWSSSDKSIATVANGVVSGVKAGTVTITCSLEKDKNIKSTFKVTVKSCAHSYSSWTVVKKSTCNEYGYQTRNCSLCNLTDYEALTTLAKHTPDSKTVRSGGTCKKNARDVILCTVCGYECQSKEVPNSKKDHLYEKYISDKNATYTKDGTKTAECFYGCSIKKTVADKGSKKKLGTTSKITTSVTSSSVTLNWKKVTGADGYRVYRKTSDGWKALGYTTKLTYTEKSLKANTKYEFAVRAYVLDGKTKVLAPKYKSVSATTSKSGLGTTSKITASKTSSTVKLTWNKVSGATGYRVYQKTSSGWKTLANTTNLTYTIKSLKANTSYTFAIRAYVTKSGKTTLAPKYKSIAVTTAKASSSKPAQVKNVKANPTATTVKLTWSKVSGVKGYEVFSYNSKTKKYTSLGKTTGTTYTVKKLKSNTAYSYAVQAYKVSGKKNVYGKASSVVKVTTLLAAPTVKISSTKGKANLTWNNIAGESGYAIYMATSKNGKYTHLANYKANSTKATKSKLKSGKTYYFKVRAYKKANGKTTYGAYSAVKSVKIK